MFNRLFTMLRWYVVVMVMVGGGRHRRRHWGTVFSSHTTLGIRFFLNLRTSFASAARRDAWVGDRTRKVQV